MGLPHLRARPLFQPTGGTWAPLPPQTPRANALPGATLGLTTAPAARAEVAVTTVDLLAPMGLQVNAAGPLLVRADSAGHRIVAVNAPTSSISLIDGALWLADPLSGRVFALRPSKGLAPPPVE